MEGMPLTLSALCRCRGMRPLGPGSLSTVANEMIDIELRTSDDIEWSSSNSRRLALGSRSESRRHSLRFTSLMPEPEATGDWGELLKLPPAALTVSELFP